jgi:methionyl aminopeptidase
MAHLKTPAEIELMSESGKRLGEILALLAAEVRPGLETVYFDEKAFGLIKKSGAEPAFLHYKPTGAKKGYPATICVSVNDVIVHGVPSNYVIKDGDLVSLDLGLVWKGWYADAAVTVCVGKCDGQKKKLVDVTKKALELGIAAARPGNTIGDIGYAIEHYVRSQRLSIADGLTGHGIGRELHEEPYVYNVGKSSGGEKLRSGMVIAIEPMVVTGKSKIKQLPDDSYATADGSLAAHFEHTVAITENGPKILTQ